MNAIRKYDILENHNDCDITILRNKSEQIRNDPFDLGNTVKGLTYLNHNKNLSDYALELVGEYATYSCDQYELHLEMLPEEEQNELVRLYLEETGRELTECVNGNDFSIENDYTCALLAMLQNNCEETREHFAETTRKNIITYYSSSLEELLANACDNYLHNTMNEQGYYAHTDAEHGDIIWDKF